jgi:glutathione S-transferase
MMEVFGGINSRAIRCIWTLEEVEAPYEIHPIDFAKGEQRSPEFLALNPAGKVPAFRHGELVLTESAAICNYIAEQFPEKGLIPVSGGPERAHFDQWMFFAMSELEQPLWSMGKHRFALPEAQRIPEMIEVAKWEFDRALEILRLGLGHRDYILGENFSVADILLGQTLFWARTFKLPVEHANLVTYSERLRERPAFQRVRALSKEGK